MRVDASLWWTVNSSLLQGNWVNYMSTPPTHPDLNNLTLHLTAYRADCILVRRSIQLDRALIIIYIYFHLLFIYYL